MSFHAGAGNTEPSVEEQHGLSSTPRVGRSSFGTSRLAPAPSTSSTYGPAGESDRAYGTTAERAQIKRESYQDQHEETGGVVLKTERGKRKRELHEEPDVIQSLQVRL